MYDMKFDLLPITIYCPPNLLQYNKQIYYDMITVTGSVKINHLIAKKSPIFCLLM